MIPRARWDRASRGDTTRRPRPTIPLWSRHGSAAILLTPRAGLATAAVVAALLCTTTPAGAQNARAPASDAALAARLEPSIRSVVMPVIDSAAADRLPVRPLLDKALEGQSKDAAPDRIAAVVRALAGDLGAARRALGRGSSEGELSAGASALHAGAPASTLTELRRVRDHEPLAVPLAVLTELVARGVAPDTASATVVALTRQHADDRALVSFRQDVDHDVALGASPSVSAAMRAADVAAAGSASVPNNVSTGGHSPSPPVPPPPSPKRP
jgi:hypothetical protein